MDENQNLLGASAETIPHLSTPEQSEEHLHWVAMNVPTEAEVEEVEVNNKILKVQAQAIGSFHLGKHGEMHPEMEELKYKDKCVVCMYDRKREIDSNRTVETEQYINVSSPFQPDSHLMVDPRLMTPRQVGHTFIGFRVGYVALFTPDDEPQGKPFRLLHARILQRHIPKEFIKCPLLTSSREIIHTVRIPLIENKVREYRIFGYFESGTTLEVAKVKLNHLNEVFAVNLVKDDVRGREDTYHVMLLEYPSFFAKDHSYRAIDAMLGENQ